MYEDIHDAVQKYKNKTVILNDNTCGMPQNFVECLHVYTGKINTALKSKALVSYPIHAILPNVLLLWRKYTIDHGLRIIGFFPVEYESTVMPQSRQTAPDVADLKPDNEYGQALYTYGFSSPKYVEPI